MKSDFDKLLGIIRVKLKQKENNMQTIQLQVNENYVQSVLTLLNSLKDGMIEKLEVRDKNLEYDPYFYERREQLHQIRADIRSGKEPMYDFNESMDELIKELE